MMADKTPLSHLMFKWGVKMMISGDCKQITIDLPDGLCLVDAAKYDKLMAVVEKRPASPYTFVTKTVAGKIVRKVLKDNDFKCYHDMTPDDEEYEDQIYDWCCSICPIYTVLGQEGGDRVCTRRKRWSK